MWFAFARGKLSVWCLRVAAMVSSARWRKELETVARPYAFIKFGKWSACVAVCACLSCETSALAYAAAAWLGPDKYIQRQRRAFADQDSREVGVARMCTLVPAAVSLPLPLAGGVTEGLMAVWSNGL